MTISPHDRLMQSISLYGIVLIDDDQPLVLNRSIHWPQPRAPEWLPTIDGSYGETLRMTDGEIEDLAALVLRRFGRRVTRGRGVWIVGLAVYTRRQLIEAALWPNGRRR